MRKTLKLAVQLLATVVIVATGYGGFLFKRHWDSLPSEQDIRTYARTKPSRIGAENVSVDQLPALLVPALLAAENSRYLTDGGAWGDCVLRGIRLPFTVKNDQLRRVFPCGDPVPVMAARLLLGSRSPGNIQIPRISTVAQMVWKMETVLSRLEITEIVFNRSYFGSGTYGISAAARRYFNKAPQELSLTETAYMAGLLKGPSNYGLQSSPQRARKRTVSVLTRMLERGMISRAQWETAVATPLTGHAKGPVPVPRNRP